MVTNVRSAGPPAGGIPIALLGRILAKATVGRWVTGKGLSRPNDPSNDSTLPGYVPTGHENAYGVVGRSNLDPCQPRTIPSNDTETLLRRLLSFFTLPHKQLHIPEVN